MARGRHAPSAGIAGTEAEPPVAVDGVDVPSWQLELDRVGLVRRMLLARKWYGGDWWFVLVSAILLLFIITVGVFPGWFAPYDPRAEVGPSLLAPGELSSQYVLVAPRSDRVTALRDVGNRDNQIGYVVGTPAAQALRGALDELNAEAAAEDEGVRYQPRPTRYDTLEEALAALADGAIDAVVAAPDNVEVLLGGYPDLEIAASLSEAADAVSSLAPTRLARMS